MKINPAINDEWVQWIKAEYIPGLLSTGLFLEHRFFKLLSEDELDGITYVMQFSIAGIDEYEKYIADFAAQFARVAYEKWGDQFVAFQTVMQIVH